MKNLKLLFVAACLLTLGLSACSSTGGSRGPASDRSYSCSSSGDKFMVDCDR